MAPDLHNHFMRWGDVGEIVDAAAQAGVSELGFAEHVFHIDEARAASAYLRERFTPEGPPVPHATYVAAIRAAAAHAPIPLRTGIEFDVRPEDPALAEASNAFLATYGAEWDVVIGSVHVVDDDADIHAIDGTRPAREVWRDYVERLRFAVASGLYDVVSHPVRLGYSLRGTPPEVGGLLDDLARDAATHDCPLEINGTDLRQRPDLVSLLIAACARARAPVALGSDAHTPRFAGGALGALGLLRERGIRHVAGYAHRVRTSHSIG